MEMRRLRMNKKGLSVIFGVLILIAIAVIAGIIIYLYTSGYLATMMGGGSAGQEKVSVVSVNATTTTVSVFAKSVGGGTVNVDVVVIKDAAGSVIATVDITDVPLPAAGTTTKVNAGGLTLTSGGYYTATLFSKLGNSFVTPTFKVP